MNEETDDLKEILWKLCLPIRIALVLIVGFVAILLWILGDWLE